MARIFLPRRAIIKRKSLGCSFEQHAEGRTHKLSWLVMVSNR